MATRRLGVLPPNAWLLDFSPSMRAAVGTRVLLQILDAPSLYEVPCTPDYCHSVLSWQGRLLPVMDMAARLGEAPQAGRLVAVAGYQDGPNGAVHFGALLLAAPPQAIAVGDAQSCALPESFPIEYAISCFDHEGEAIPILHLARIFSE